METDPLSRAEAYLEKAGLIDSPGAVLYSADETLRPGPVYLLGLNPGGAVDSTLRDSIMRSRAQNNAYLDEEWAPGGHVRPKGQATLQRRIQHLCSMMGIETRDVPASNLVFTRSTRVSTHLSFDAALKFCLPVHDIFIDAIRPRFLMTFGNIDNFKNAVAITHMEERSAQHHKWMAYRGNGTIAGREIAFGNVPHMSVWASDQRPEIVRWAIDALV
jgi:hypothetical protein